MKAKRLISLVMAALMLAGAMFIFASCGEKVAMSLEIDGKTYPLFKLDTSSESHPFYTGAQTRIVEAGRVEKFRAKFAAKNQELNAAAAKAKAK